MRITHRDMSLFSCLACFGSLSTPQIGYHLRMSPKVLQRRLRKLRDMVGYLACMERPVTGLGRAPYLWFLSRSGAEFAGVPFSKPRLTLRFTHQMQNNDILLGTVRSFEGSGVTCRVLPEHLMRQAQLELVPDGAFLLSTAEGGPSALFLLENDAGSAIVSSPSLHDDLEGKVITYQGMFSQNEVGFYERFFRGTKLTRFRLLVITRSRARADAIAQIAQEHDDSGFIWISTTRSFRKHGIRGRIWDVPATGESGRAIVEAD